MSGWRCMISEKDSCKESGCGTERSIFMDHIITTEQLTKRYKHFTSVDRVSMHIRRGSIYGFLGPNGAGKSTTMKMLLGLTTPTSGSFSVDGAHFPENRLEILRKTGSFIESPS